MSAEQSQLAHYANDQGLHSLRPYGLVEGDEPLALADIYKEDVHIAIWRRSLSTPLQETVSHFIKSNPGYKKSVTVTPQSASATLQDALGAAGSSELRNDIVDLVDMFCTLFALERAGVRLSVLDSAMCPKFHVDRIPCRLITTYQGVATDWLPHESVDRGKLGHGSGGLADCESGLYKSHEDIMQLQQGDVGLLKGDLWEGNEGKGLVHRSPSPEKNDRRLLLTLDFIN